MTDLNKESLVHMNDNFQVVYIPEHERGECKDEDGTYYEANYEVRHRKYDTVDFKTASLASALAVAEQLDNILTNKLYLTTAFGGAEEEDFYVDITTQDENNGGGTLN